MLTEVKDFTKRKLTDKKIEEIAELLKIISNGRRLKILYLLEKFGKLSNQELQVLLNTKQSVISIQLECGITSNELL